MLDIYALRDMATNVAQGLKATREGNTAALEQAIAAAQKGLTGMQTAASTRQTIQQTTQAKELFPSKLTQEQEAATQAGQKTTRESMSLEDYENKRQYFKKKYQIDITPEDFLSGTTAMRAGLVAEGRTTPESIASQVNREERAGVLKGMQAESGIAAEPIRAKSVEAGLSADVSENINKQIMAKSMRHYNIGPKTVEFMAGNIGIEALTAAANASAAQASARAREKTADLKERELEEAASNRKVLLDVMKEKGWTESSLLYYETAMEMDLELTEQEFTQHLSLLTRTIAEIQQAATVTDAVKAAAAIEGLPSAFSQSLFNLASGGKADNPLRTQADKNAAISIIRTFRDELVTDRNKIRPEQRDRFILPVDKGIGKAAGVTTGTGAAPVGGITSDESIDSLIDKIMGN